MKLVEAKVVLRLGISQKDDVDFRRNRLRLINEKNIEREADVSSRCIALIGNAMMKPFYLKRNGYISENTIGDDQAIY